jgi:hypothetical protein
VERFVVFSSEDFSEKAHVFASGAAKQHAPEAMVASGASMR